MLIQMWEFIKFLFFSSIILFFICLITNFLLATINNIKLERVKAKAIKELKKSIKNATMQIELEKDDK